ncbi:MAG TPA: NAD(P)H-binding protein [Steroidobacteraceae bacterium]|nr:NAD(P)H-binding protein [Steroidobacteraceae bacterium]HRX88145.1 NAD(P)H-binding protein [Steroidobacteraceae bacterium]
MKIAVAAASGRLGHAVLRELLTRTEAQNVVAVARTPARVQISGIDVRRGDYASTDSMIAALGGVDTVVLISAPVGEGDRTLLHRNAINAARRANVRKLVYTSVIGNGNERDTWFWDVQQINRQTEDDLKTSGLEWVIVRNGLYLELDLRHVIDANGSGVYSNNARDGQCGYITIDELAVAIARVSAFDIHNGRTLNLVGESMTQSALVALASDVFGLDLRYETISDEENIARLMSDEKIAARGRDVAQMLAGCFQCIRNGAFDVPSDFEQAAGRPVKATRQMMEQIRRTLGTARR